MRKYHDQYYGSYISSMVGDENVLNHTKVRETGPGIDRTFIIEEGPPTGQSYAREIATKYGISYPQLIKKLGLEE